MAAAVGRIEAPIGRDPKHRTRMAVVPDGRASTTGYRVRERFAGWTLLELDLVTGRTHQIRVHLDAIGHPVAGDPVYGTGTSRRGPDGLDRLFLHAWRLELAAPGGRPPHPGDGRAAARARGRARGPAAPRRPPGDRRCDDDRRRRSRSPSTSRTTRAARRRHPGRPGGDARDHLGPVRRGQGHDHRRHAPPRGRDRPDRRAPLRRDRARPGHRATARSTASTTTSSRARSSCGIRAARGFLEANEVHGNWYGSPRDQVREALAAGRDVILKIDVQGAQIVKEQVTEALLIFVIPPTLETLFARLRARATETADELELRQRNAAIELARQDDYDHVVVNETGQVERTAERIEEIIAEERGRIPTGGSGSRSDDPRARARAGPGSGRGRRSRPWPIRAATPRRGRGGRGRSRRRAAVHVPRAGAVSPISRTARPCSSSSAGGRRSGSCSVRPSSAPGPTPKPIVDRVRADGPLLPALTLALARWIAEHYLAPPALVIRSMLPPGLLERLELVAERTPVAIARRTCRSRSDRDLLDAAGRRPAAGPRPRRPGRAGRPPAPLARPRGRGPRHARLDAARGLGRSALRALDPAAAGRAGRGAAPRRRANGRPAGRSARASSPRSPSWPPDRCGRTACRPPTLGQRATGPPRSPSLVRRGLAETEVRERPRRPLASRAPGLRGGRPTGRGPVARPGRRRWPGSTRRDRGPRPAAAPPRRRDRRRQDRDLRRGHRRVAWPPAGRPSCSSPRSRWRCRWSTGCGPTSTPASRSSTRGSGDGERADEWRRIRAGDVDIVVGTRLAVVAPLADVGARSSSTRSTTPAYKSDRTPRLQARDAAIRLAELAGAALVLGSATPAVDSLGRALDGHVRPGRAAASGRSARAPDVEVVDLRAELAEGNRGLLSRALDDALAALDTRGRRAGHPRPQPAGDRLGRAVPRLRPRPGLPGLRAAARLPPGRHDPALPPLRSRDAARDALPGLRLAADPLPGRRHGTGRARGPRRPPAAARRAAGPGRRGAPGSGGAGARRVRGGPDRRARRDEPRRQGPRRAGGHAGRGRVIGRRPQPARRTRRGADVPAAQPGGRAGRAAAIGPAGRSSRPTSRTTRSSGPWRRATATTFYAAELALRRRFGSPPFGRLVKLTVALPDRERGGTGGRRRWPSGCGSGPRARDTRSSGRRRPTSPGATTAGGITWSCAATTRSACSDGDPGPPWSVDVDPESLL